MDTKVKTTISFAIDSKLQILNVDLTKDEQD